MPSADWMREQTENDRCHDNWVCFYVKEQKSAIYLLKSPNSED